MSIQSRSVINHILYFFFPFLSWMRGYSLPTFKIDVNAGIAVALVLVPQSMANAQLAGLPAYHGIYAALFPALVGGIWGSSRQMVTGSVAVVCLMAAAALEPLGISSPAGYIAYMALLTLLVGVVQLVLGVCRMGIVVNFLSLPVIAGFMNASAVIIAASQFAKLVGVSVDSADRQYRTFITTLESAWNYVHMPSLAMAGIALAVMWAVRRFAPRFPAVLAAVVLTTLLSWALNFENKVSVDLDAIHSDEARILLTRLAQQEAELGEIRTRTQALERITAETTAEALDLEYKQQELYLLQLRIANTMRLAREHLRRMLFVAEQKQDGTYAFYAQQSPGLVPIAPDDDSGARPAAAFADGKTWRILLGSGAPDLDYLTMSSGGAVVGPVPSSLPYFQMPSFSLEKLLLLLPQALIIAFVGFAESISIGKSAANLGGYRLDANQELVGQGLANIAGGLTLTSPVSGSFSNSAVNIAAGAKTGISCVIASFGALITLLFFTGALQYVPQPVLAVIVIRAVGGLIQFREFTRVWTAQWYDGCIAVITFFATLYFAPHLDYGIALGIVLSLISFFFRSMKPRISALSCGPDRMLRDVKLFNLEECRHIALVQFQGALFFANSAVLEDHVLWRLENQKELRHIHFICSGISHIDASGEDALAMLVNRAKKQGISVSFSGVLGSVAEVLGRTGIMESVGWENVYLTPREAVCAIHKRIQHDARCTTCPLTNLFCRSAETDDPDCGPRTLFTNPLP